MEPKSNRYAHNVISKQSWVNELVYGNYNVKISFTKGIKLNSILFELKYGMCTIQGGYKGPPPMFFQQFTP